MRQELAGEVYLKHYKTPGKSGLWGRLKNVLRGKKDDFKIMAEILLESISIASQGSVTSNIEQAKPEILLEPIVNISLLDFTKVDQAIEAGRKAGKAALPEILRLVGR